MPGVAAISLPCTGALPPSFIDFALKKGADGVFLTGCRMGDCYHRPGNTWVEQRLADERKPQLHRSVDRMRVAWFWAAVSDEKLLIRSIEEFRQKLPARDNGATAVKADTADTVSGN